MTEQRADLAVIGGGLTGLALAIAVAGAGRRVLVVEASPHDPSRTPRFDGRVTAVAQGSRRFLEAIGVWPDLEPGAGPILDIEVAEGGRPAAVRYDHRDVGTEPLGHIVENVALREALERRAARTAGVTMRRPARLVNLVAGTDAATLDLDDGASWRAALVAVCEGKGSATRERLGIRALRWTYSQLGLVATFGHELPHRGVALERFFPDGPFAVLPMRGERISLVWAAREDLARRIAALPDAEFLAEVALRVGEQLGALWLEGHRWSYPLELVWADRYVADRAVLVGDAARAIHPIAGQGWNLAIRDVAAIAEIVVDRTRAGLDPGSPDALERYAAWRRFDSLALVGITDGLTRLFGMRAAPVRLAREAGLAVVERVVPLKRFFMRHAMGLVGDLPRTMRGEGL